MLKNSIRTNIFASPLKNLQDLRSSLALGDKLFQELESSRNHVFSLVFKKISSRDFQFRALAEDRGSIQL